MIGYIDIQEAVINVLHEFKDIDVVSNDIKSGFDKPAFFIKLIPLIEEDLGEYFERKIMIIVHYFSKERTNIENLKMLDSLNSLFRTTLKVKKQVLTINDRKHEFIENTLQFKFEIEYVTGAPEYHETDKGYTDSNIEKMQELYLDLETEVK